MMNNIIDIAKTILVIVIVYVPIISIVFKTLNSMIDNWQTKNNNTVVNNYIDRAQQVVTDVVTQVNQCYADALKKSGDFSKEAQQTAKDMAIELASSLISEKVKEAIESLYGNYDTWINTTIEATVHTLKSE